MHNKITIWQKLLFLVIAQILSIQAFADCAAGCEQAYSSCQKAATNEVQMSRCIEQSAICALTCNRENTMYCTYLGFKDHEGVADKEKELEAITGGFARVSSDERPHFGGLCSSNKMTCDHVQGWDKKLYYCGGEVRHPRRVACCR